MERKTILAVSICLVATILLTYFLYSLFFGNITCLSMPVFAALTALISIIFPTTYNKLKFLLVSLLAFGILQLLLILGNSAIMEITCSSYGRVSISNLKSLEISPGDRITFCGSLQECLVTEVGPEGVQYEVCLIKDFLDDASIQFYSAPVLHSEDQIVQAFRDAQALRLQSEGTVVIDYGIFQEQIVGECLFPACNTSTPPFADVFHTSEALELLQSEQE